MSRSQIHVQHIKKLCQVQTRVLQPCSLHRFSFFLSLSFLCSSIRHCSVVFSLPFPTLCVSRWQACSLIPRTLTLWWAGWSLSRWQRWQVWCPTRLTLSAVVWWCSPGAKEVIPTNTLSMLYSTVLFRHLFITSKLTANVVTYRMLTKVILSNVLFIVMCFSLFLKGKSTAKFDKTWQECVLCSPVCLNTAFWLILDLWIIY